MVNPVVKPDAKLVRLGWVIANQTALMQATALAYLDNELKQVDGWQLTGESVNVSGGSTSNTVEAAAIRANAISDQAAKIRTSAAELERRQLAHHDLCRKTVPKVPAAADAALCDGRGYEGQAIAWVPHSREETNGWHDPTCRDIANYSRLCDACLIRMNRWRSRNGLDPIGVQEGKAA